MNRGQYEQVMFLLEQTPSGSEDKDWNTIHKARILSLWGDFEAAAAIISPIVDSTVDDISREAVLVLSTIYSDHDRGDLSKALLEKHHDRFLRGVSSLVRRRFLSRLVEAHVLTGDLDQALSWASKIVEACEAEGEEIGGAVSLRQMAAVFQRRQTLDTALSLCQHSYALLTNHNRVREAAVTEMLMASIYKDLGNLESASKHLQSSLQSFIRMGDRKNSTVCRQRIREFRSGFGGAIADSDQVGHHD